MTTKLQRLSADLRALAEDLALANNFTIIDCKVKPPTKRRLCSLLVIWAETTETVAACAARYGWRVARAWDGSFRFSREAA